MDYIDESGKEEITAKKEQEKKEGWQPSRDEEGRIITSRTKPPRKETGKLSLGGFMLDTGLDPNPDHAPKESSPSEKGHNLKKDWANKVARRWSALLNHKRYKGRRRDRYNAVITLHPGEERKINEDGWTSSAYLQAVTSRTMELYLEKRGWKNDRMGWYSGVHLDKDAPHIHLRIFPFTEQGKHLSFSNNVTSYDEEKQHRMLWITCTNQAAEEWWRENMSEKNQRPDVKLARMYGHLDPPHTPVAFYLSDAENLKNWKPDLALATKENMAVTERTVATLQQNPEFEAVKPENPTKSPGMTLRSLAALKSFTEEPDLAGFHGSQYEKEIQARGKKFVDLWKRCTNPTETNTIQELVEWARQRASRWKKDNKTTDPENQEEKSRIAKGIKKTAVRRIARILREKMGLTASEKEPESLNKEVRSKLNTGTPPAEIPNIAKGEKGFRLRTLIYQLDPRERDEIKNSSQTGRDLLIALSTKVDEDFHKSEGEPQADLTLMMHGSRCEAAAAGALASESNASGKTPSHFGEAILAKARALAPEKGSPETDSGHKFQALGIPADIRSELTQITREEEAPEPNFDIYLDAAKTRTRSKRKKGKFIDYPENNI